ncbi:hypothetical protein SDC9_123021 [bioreactor metagenome]|uniref:Uncharacterized protein n=1 Tax=bioreactor metagenome TaxID=1076179 RepID=A0A645CGD4_9ZZZZ
MLAAVTNPIAIQSRFEILSLNTISAITAVAAISKLLSNAALAAVVMVSANISSIGAAISSNTMAIVYGSSFFVSGCSVSAFPSSFSIRLTNPMPIPAPRYKNAASIIGDTSDNNSFENGELNAYNAAAATAKPMARVVFIFSISIIYRTPLLHNCQSLLHKSVNRSIKHLHCLIITVINSINYTVREMLLKYFLAYVINR